MIQRVMIDIKTQGWALQPAAGMRLSPRDGCRLEHVRNCHSR